MDPNTIFNGIMAIAVILGGIVVVIRLGQLQTKQNMDIAALKERLGKAEEGIKNQESSCSQVSACQPHQQELERRVDLVEDKISKQANFQIKFERKFSEQMGRFDERQISMASNIEGIQKTVESQNTLLGQVIGGGVK